MRPSGIAMLAGALVACAGPIPPGSTAEPPRATTLPTRPGACTEIAATERLHEAIERALEGDTLCLGVGTHAGPITLTKRLTLWGPREAVIHGRTGSTVVLKAAGTQLLGLTVDGSGTRSDTTDAAIRIEANDVRVAGVRVTGATFGITSEKASGLTITDNEIVGSHDDAIGLRGDGIRLWETNDAVIERNRMHGSRDLVVWYSSRNVFRHNEVRDSRYGTHFMFSHDNVVEENTYVGNTVGIFVMYSRNLRIARNVLAGSLGSAGIGLGLKESGNLEVVDNRIVHDTTGIYLDTTPLQVTDANTFTGNELRFTQAALVFHGSEKRNTFRANRFADNRVVARVEGGADALGVTFEGNDFDDYAGYDLDGDGLGDLPYEVRSLSGDLTGKHPALAFLSGTPALALVDAVGKAIPLFTPKVLLRDPRPRVGAMEVHDARRVR